LRYWIVVQVGRCVFASLLPHKILRVITLGLTSAGARLHNPRTRIGHHETSLAPSVRPAHLNHVKETAMPTGTIDLYLTDMTGEPVSNNPFLIR
jgi:hypothetical protein